MYSDYNIQKQSSLDLDLTLRGGGENTHLPTHQQTHLPHQPPAHIPPRPQVFVGL